MQQTNTRSLEEIKAEVEECKSGKPGAGRRGRRPKPHDEYMMISLEKIRKWEAELKKKGLKSKDKVKLQNKISAQSSRMRREKEKLQVDSDKKKIHERAAEFVKLICTHLGKESKEKLHCALM